jgi:hypothetical protein
MEEDKCLSWSQGRVRGEEGQDLGGGVGNELCG